MGLSRVFEIEQVSSAAGGGHVEPSVAGEVRNHDVFHLFRVGSLIQ